MQQGRVEKAAEVSFQKRKIIEKKKQQKHLWGSLFLEFLLSLFWEKEVQELHKEKDEGDQQKLQLEIEVAEDDPEEKANPWKKEDKLEILTWGVDETFISEEYGNMAKAIRCVADSMESEHLHNTYQIMRDFYTQCLPEEELSTAIQDYYGKFFSHEGAYQTKEHIRDVMQEIYEYFLRANVRSAVEWNNREGNRLFEESGIRPEGILYYNAEYFYRSKLAEQCCRQINDIFLLDYEIPELDYKGIFARNRFSLCGGIKFHGVWEWVQQRNTNIYGKYSLKRQELEPPMQFAYLYRNRCDEHEIQRMEEVESNLCRLLSSNETRTELRKFVTTSGGRESNNGISGLLEENILQKEQEAASFLGNFRVFQVSGRMEMLYTGE